MASEDFRTIWLHPDDPSIVQIIDQRRLPHEYHVHDLRTWKDGVTAIKEMYVRGAPLIGVTAAYGVYLAALNAPDGRIENNYLIQEANRIKAARPTAVNLTWAVDNVMSRVLAATEPNDKIESARKQAGVIAEQEVVSIDTHQPHGNAPQRASCLEIGHDLLATGMP